MVNIEKYRFVTDGNSEGTLKIEAVELSLGLIFFLLKSLLGQNLKIREKIFFDKKSTLL